MLFYNPPETLAFLRINEIAIELVDDADETDTVTAAAAFMSEFRPSTATIVDEEEEDDSTPSDSP